MSSIKLVEALLIYCIVVYLCIEQIIIIVCIFSTR